MIGSNVMLKWQQSGRVPLVAINSLYNHYGLRWNQSIYSKRLINNGFLLKCDNKVKQCYRTAFVDSKRTTKPHLKVVQIWEGMTEKQLAQACELTVNDVYDALHECNLKKLQTLEEIEVVTKRLQRRFSVISNPFKVDAKKDVTLKQLFEKNQLPKGTKMATKIPVVTIMGHVDHGKTTLLDALRESEIVKQEFGGITQHIGAFIVSLDDQSQFKKSLLNKKPNMMNKRSLQIEMNPKELVTFLDTPGHAAFSGMRQRGAEATDLVVLVVAADDGVMQQTIESVEFAKQNKVPIIVAINKIDRFESSKLDENLLQIKEGLSSIGVQLEDLGGDIQSIPISALKKIGLNSLKDAIIALSETLELKAPVDGGVRATIIESSLDEHRGKLATLLVHQGTLKKGDILLSENGIHLLKVRQMFDEYSNVLNVAKPGVPVQVIGWKEPNVDTASIESDNIIAKIPNSGETLIQMRDEPSAKKVQHFAINKLIEAKAKEFSAEGYKKLDIDRVEYQNFLEQKRKSGRKFIRMRTEVKKMVTFDEQEERKRLNVIIKADTYGTLETLLDIFDSFPGEQDVKINMVHYGIGTVSDNDIKLASCFYETKIYAFNVPSKLKANKTIKSFNVIYHLVEDLKTELSNRLPELEKHNEIGEATVLQQFLINEKNKKVPVAGCRCNKGVLKSDHTSFYKVIRNGVLIAERLRIVSMRHLKDEVSSIKSNTECGLRFDNPAITFMPNDIIVNYIPYKAKQKIKWTPKGFI